MLNMIRATWLPLALALTACNPVSTPAAAGAIVGAQPSARRPPARPTPGARPGTAPAPTGEETGKLAGLTAAHNAVRAQVGVAALTWSNQLGAYAQAWADQLAANGCTLAHRPPGSDSWGENLYWSSASTGVDAVVATWAAEKSQYDHPANSCSGICGHYTQIVWAQTTKVGCGVATCGSAEVWVCNYDPQGNVLGQSPY